MPLIKKQFTRRTWIWLAAICLVILPFAWLVSLRMVNLVIADMEARSDACINHLRQIDSAKQEWALETHALSNATPTWADIQPYMGRGPGSDFIPRCYQGGHYTIGSLQ